MTRAQATRLEEAQGRMWGAIARSFVGLIGKGSSRATISYPPIDIRFVAEEKRLAPEDWSKALAVRDPETVERVRAAARGGDPRAQTACGHLLLSGHGVARDSFAAFRWFEMAARREHAEAANMLGRCHELGWGTGVDPGRAAHWYREAARRGDAWAQFNLAMLLFDGHGCKADRGEALAWFVRAARRRHAKAMGMVGRYREEGWRHRPRPLAAFRWYRRAAEGGDFRGQFNYGRCLFQAGFRDEALRWISAAIEAGIPIFCMNVAATLLRHEDSDLRALGACALAKARGGAPPDRHKTGFPRQTSLPDAP